MDTTPLAESEWMPGGQPEPPAEPDILDGMFDAAWLMEQDFPALQFVVPGLIPEGLSMIAAAPKAGKSWLVLGVAIAAATGGRALGHIKVDQRPVLYLALEDGQRRLQERLVALEAYQPPKALRFITTAERGKITPMIEAFMERYGHQRPLIVLDTLGKAMPRALAGETTYDRDYRVMSWLKRQADEHPGSSILCVHHTRKADSTDFVDAVSGTQGLAGAADTTLLLKRERHERTATLQVTSRDIREGQYQLELCDTGTWKIEGTTLEDAAAAAHTTQLTEGVGDRQAEVIAAVGRYAEGITPKDLKVLMSDMKPADVDVYLKRAFDAGRIRKLKRGLYGPMPSNI